VTAANGYAGERTILFGGSGFLGPYILERCPEMISVGRTPPRTDNRHIAIDTLSDLGVLADLDFDRVIYIIGNTDHHNLEKVRLDPDEPNAFDYHVHPLIDTLEQLKHFPIRKFIHFSSILVYDPNRLPDPVPEDAPVDPYRNRYVLSKYMAEEVSKFYERWMPIVTCRFCNLYGPTPLERHDLIHVTARELLAEGEAEIWNASPERDFLYVTDAAEAIIKLLHSEFSGLVNLGTGTLTSVGRVMEILSEVSGLPIRELGRPVAGPMRFRSDTTRLKSAIDWEPRVSIEEGVREVWETTRRWWGDGA
jgi:nucleoside-diphosphate-sugar epimerase